MKTLAMDTILANARFFDGDLAKVPTMALTVGVGTVMDAKEVNVQGSGRRPAVAEGGPRGYLIINFKLHRHQGYILTKAELLISKAKLLASLGTAPPLLVEVRSFLG